MLMKLSFWCSLMTLGFLSILGYEFGGDALFLAMMIGFLSYSIGVWVGTDLERSNKEEVENDLA